MITNNSTQKPSFYQKNRDKFQEYNKAYYQRTKDRYKDTRKETRVKWQADNKEYFRAYMRAYNKKWHKKERETNLNYKIACNLRCRMWQVLNEQDSSKADSLNTLLGCSLNDFRRYIESLFEDGMSWDNYALDTWHIDHIKPCNTFDLTKPEQQRECFHYSNLRPLWAMDNWTRPKDGSDI